MNVVSFTAVNVTDLIMSHLRNYQVELEEQAKEKKQKTGYYRLVIMKNDKKPDE